MPLVLQAQITAPGSSATRNTKYPVNTGKDKIFIFCASSASSGTLVASIPNRTGPFTFAWTKYDQSTGNFFSFGKTNDNGATSTASLLTEGGYRVHVYDGVFDTLMTAWVNLDNPSSNAALKNRTCSYVALDGTISIDNFYYYDLSNRTPVLLPDAIDFLWSSLPASTIKPRELDPIIGIPPLTDMTYMLQVTDSFGCAATSSFDYESIHVDAAFTATPTSGDAPLEVTFTDNSVRAKTWLWDFGDDSVSYLADPPPHKYYIPGTYKVTLTIESEMFCTDVYQVDIDVNESALAMPNVFSPNGDGINDTFVPDFSSLMYVTIQIFSKGGQRVYKFEAEGEKVSEWTGWDGKVNNSERYAEPGVYYYVIKGKGWDDREYKGEGYRGIVYLYR